MKQKLKIIGYCVVLALSVWTLVYANTTLTFMRIGRLWMIYEYDGAEGWGGQSAWPGGYPMEGAFSGIRELWDGNVRKLGTLAGVKDWTGPNNVFYPYWTSGMYRTYNYDYPDDWIANEQLTVLFPVSQTEIMRWEPPRVIVNGKDIIADAGDEYVKVHERAKIDPTLVTERAVESVWDYSMGVTYRRIAYGYSGIKHGDYTLWDITFTNTGNITGVQQPALANQTIKDFWWAQTANPWNSHAGRSFSFGADDASGEFIQPFGDNHRYYLFYDDDNAGSPEKDWGDPSKDSRWIRLLSPAYIAFGPLHIDKNATDTSDDPTQPRSTIIGHERSFDLSKTPKTMQEQYELIFNEGSQWALNTPHRDIDPAIRRPSGYTAVGPYDMGPGEDIHMIFVWAAGGINMKLCREYGKKAVLANYTGPVMDEIETLVKTGRDSLLQTMNKAWWNAKGSYPDGSNPKPAGHGAFDVPDAPRPPAEFRVNAEGPKIILQWTNESDGPDFDTGVNDFAGYRVYRAIGRRDSTYHKVWEGTANRWTDADVKEGFQYFYYLVAYDDGSQNWEDPGVSLESGRFYCWTGWAAEGVTPTTAPVTTEAAFDKIMVVPNPYSSAGKTFPGEADKILFTGLPGRCTIKVFTSAGDYVTTIHHTDGSGSEEWNLRTEFNQYVVSDVYIYTVESDLGDHIGKFVVVR